MTTFVAALAWAFLCLPIYQSEDMIFRSAGILLILGIIAAGVPTLSSLLPAFIAHALTPGSALALTLLMERSDLSLFLGTGTIIFILLTLIVSKKFNQRILESLRLQDQNRELIEKLNAEIDQRTNAQQALERHQALLEEQVKDRTIQLATTNRNLQREVVERKKRRRTCATWPTTTTSPICQTACFSKRVWNMPCRERSAPAPRWRFFSSIWTISSTSTTAWVMRSATSCFNPSAYD